MYKYLFLSLLSCLAVSTRSHSGHHSDHHEHDDDHIPEGTKPPVQVSDHRFFLHEIFTKYGHNGQMTFEEIRCHQCIGRFVTFPLGQDAQRAKIRECFHTYYFPIGFEHLLESLGLGNIIITDHDVSAHKEDAFQSTHDSHDHHGKKDARPHADHDEHAHTSSMLHPTSSATGGKILSSLKHTQQPSMTPARNRVLDNNINSISSQDELTKAPVRFTSIAPTKTSKNPATTVSTLSPEDIYHYRLPDAEIPELLVNISTLVDQHQELANEAQEMVIEQCLSPKEILETFGINQNGSLNPVSFLHLCPAIIYELDQGHCMFRDMSHKKHKHAASVQQWLYALLAVTIISLCGLFSVAVIPIMQKWFYQTLLQFLVGLAVGSLAGDGLLHLMPHAMLPGEGGHGRESLLMEVAEKTAVWRGFTALSGILFFFMAERLLSVLTSRKNAKKTAKDKEEIPEPMLYSEGKVGLKLSQYRKNSHFELGQKEMMHMLKKVESQNPYKDAELEAGHGHGHSHGHSHEMPDSISAVAWMVIMGDGLHNFCDGLAIGAAFASGIEGGISTSVAVFCHELPHELGDFAMLLRTGMGVRQALCYNILSSALCLAGTAIGLSLGGVSSATGWVFAVTAGIFLYVALVDMLPELAAANDPNLSPLYQLAIQVLGISTGVSIMLLIANYEQELQSIVS